MKRPRSHIAQCPGLKITTNAGVTFTDSLGRVHDLETGRTLRPKEAAADPRLGGASIAEVRRLVRDGTLYPVLKRNARVILIYDCALTDWLARELARRPLRHLSALRAARVA